RRIHVPRASARPARTGRGRGPLSPGRGDHGRGACDGHDDERTWRRGRPHRGALEPSGLRGRAGRHAPGRAAACALWPVRDRANAFREGRRDLPPAARGPTHERGGRGSHRSHGARGGACEGRDVVTSRVGVAALAALALLAAGWGGLSRLGLAPRSPGDTASYHGALMVSSFIGTLIGLERAIVMRRTWAYLAPILSSAAGVALLVGAGAPIAALLVAGAATAFLAVTVRGAPSSPGTAIVVMSAGAAAWLVGAVLWWQGAAAFRSMPWWSAFLVLTIAAERLELARALRPSGRATAVLVLAATGLRPRRGPASCRASSRRRSRSGTRGSSSARSSWSASTASRRDGAMTR